MADTTVVWSGVFWERHLTHLHECPGHPGGGLRWELHGPLPFLSFPTSTATHSIWTLTIKRPPTLPTLRKIPFAHGVLCQPSHTHCPQGASGGPHTAPVPAISDRPIPCYPRARNTFQILWMVLPKLLPQTQLGLKNGETSPDPPPPHTHLFPFSKSPWVHFLCLFIVLTPKREAREV